jgi:hypothetical protein
MKNRILSHKGEIKQLYKLTLDMLQELDEIPYYKIDEDGSNLYSYVHIKPFLDDDEFYKLFMEFTYNT